SMSPRYAFTTAKSPTLAAAVGSAWSAFFRPLPATSPIDTQPEPEPEPLEIAGHTPADSFPRSRPVSTSMRYSALPAFGAAAPRFGISVSMAGKYPEPTITAVVSRALSSAPTAGSDQVNPTVFSAYGAVAFRSP